MNARLIKLIDLVNRIELLRLPDSKLRDRQYEISWTHNYGDPYFYVAHDGFQWAIEQYIPPSENQFADITQATNALWRVLKERFKTVKLWHEFAIKDKHQIALWTQEEIDELYEEYKDIVEDED